MKACILIWMFMVICNIQILAEHYYYYHGEKVPLVVNTDSLTIYATLANMQISNPSDSIIVSTVPIEMAKQLSVHERWQHTK